MKKVMSFLTGLMCGTVVGGVAALLFAPASGEDLVASVQQRVKDAIEEGQNAMASREQELQQQFDQMKKG